MEKILDRKLTIEKSEEKTHKKVLFNINKEVNKLKIEFEYNPKSVCDKKYIIEAFDEGRCDMTSEEALFFKDKYIKENIEIKNLATLSLYHEDEYVGCAHRSVNNEEVVISENESTPGFKKTKVSKGKWEIVISIHGLSSENMNISLKVYVI